MSSVLRTVIAATSLGTAAAFALAGSATASPLAPRTLSRPDVAATGTGAAAATEAVLGVVQRTQLNPMNGGGLNPLSNSVGTDVGDMPVGSDMVTGDLARGMTVQQALDKL
ncbi:hypothetical protein [Embleya hyalina]|uniref:ATP-binding protein n=1 Tax=Embleya hyalina TaxID=516124 RepID=A0A401YLA0_9ACTN|nr:hypothetical protein [Embleya hyalina]GCD95373.1 hypothetical protein EHYA_03045 [Embleya hyalina]